MPIPNAPDTPYALQVLLDRFRQQYLTMMESIKKPQYKDDVNLEIEKEKVSLKYAFVSKHHKLMPYISFYSLQKFLL